MNKLTATIAEASAMTGLSRSSLYRAFAAGRLSPKKCGKRVLIPVADLTAYVESLPDANLSSSREAA